MPSEAEVTEDVVTEPQENEVVEFTTIPEETEKTQSEQLWDALGDEETNVNTMVWHTEISFSVGEKGQVRDIFAATNKTKVVDRLFAIVSSPDIKEPCDFDVSQYTTKIEAIKAFFDGINGRNLIVALIPIVQDILCHSTTMNVKVVGFFLKRL